MKRIQENVYVRVLIPESAYAMVRRIAKARWSTVSGEIQSALLRIPTAKWCELASDRGILANDVVSAIVFPEAGTVYHEARRQKRTGTTIYLSAD